MKKLLFLTLCFSTSLIWANHHYISCATDGPFADRGYVFELRDFNFIKEQAFVKVMKSEFSGTRSLASHVLKIQPRNFLFIFKRNGFVVTDIDKKLKFFINKDMTGKLVKLNGKKVSKEFRKLSCSMN